MCMRVLLVRCSARNLVSLWPVMLSEVTRILKLAVAAAETARQLRQREREWVLVEGAAAANGNGGRAAPFGGVASGRGAEETQVWERALAALELMDLALVLQPEQLQLMQWSFVQRPHTNTAPVASHALDSTAHHPSSSALAAEHDGTGVSAAQVPEQYAFKPLLQSLAADLELALLTPRSGGLPPPPLPPCPQHEPGIPALSQLGGASVRHPSADASRYLAPEAEGVRAGTSDDCSWASSSADVGVGWGGREEGGARAQNVVWERERLEMLLQRVLVSGGAEAYSSGCAGGGAGEALRRPVLGQVRVEDAGELALAAALVHMNAQRAGSKEVDEAGIVQQMLDTCFDDQLSRRPRLSDMLVLPCAPWYTSASAPAVNTANTRNVEAPATTARAGGGARGEAFAGRRCGYGRRRRLSCKARWRDERST